MPRLFLVFALLILPARAEVPPHATTTGALTPAGLARTPATITFPLPADASHHTLRLSIGSDPAGVQVTLSGKGAAPLALALHARGLTPKPMQAFPDAYIEIAPWRTRLFVRPNVEFYKDDRRTELLKTWDALPAASAHVLAIELRRTAGGTQVWLDGRFVNELPQAFDTCTIKLPTGAGFHGFTASTPAPSPYLPVSIPDRPGAMTNVRITLTPGPTALPVVPSAANADVANLGRLTSPIDDLVSLAWRRGALDALPEAAIVSVPLETYSHALLLVAAEDDPAKVPALAVRMTRYAGGRGDALADTGVRLPAGESAGARQVGSVTFGPAAARKSAPLWLLRVPLKPGLIQDLLRDDMLKNPSFPTHRYLDVELLDPLDNIDAADAFPPTAKPTGRAYTPRGARSSLHVFGLALEPSPARLTVRGSRDTNIYYAAEQPHLTATVDARAAGAYTVAWDVADVDGKIAATDSRLLTLAAGAPQAVTIPLPTENGWYATRVRLLTPDTKDTLVDHRSSCVLLPPDTRTAGFDSPHGAWWFHWAHGGAPNLDLVGPVLQRAGLRHTNLPKTLPESVTGKFGVTAWNVNWFTPRGKPDMPLAERLAAHEAFIREQLRLWPSIDTMMIWHESGAGGAAFPSELWGVAPPPPAPEVEKTWQVRMNYVTALAKMVREKFPNLKMQYGNDGASLGIIAELLRRKFPRELIDTIAVEDLGQTIIPEKPIPNALQSPWYLRQTARKLGYEIPVTAAYEWMGRRDLPLGAATQAEWYVRDALHARVYGFRQVAIGTIHDAGAGYFHTLWGGGGLTRRYPQMDPKPAYAAIATHTRVLDRATFVRAVPTSSPSLYALEFTRGRDAAEHVYALWVPRGQRRASLALDARSEVTLIDLYGRQSTRRAEDLDLTVTTAPQYLVTRARLASITPGPATFPDDAPPAQLTIVDPLDSVDTVTVQPDKDNRLERTTGEHMPHRTLGQFALRPVTDPEKGQCLEVELKPRGEIWEMTHEYTVLKFKSPQLAPSPTGHVGLWLNGNSGWGEVMFEVTNAKGQTHFSQGVYMDWPGRIAANFDGWNFLRLQLPDDPAWRTQVKVTGLVLTIPRKMLYLTDVVPVPDLRIRIKSLCAF